MREFTITVSADHLVHVQFEDRRGLIEINTTGEHPSVTILDYDLAEGEGDHIQFDFSRSKALQDA